MPWQKTSALASLVKQITDSNGRRLQANWATPDCLEACPKTMEFLTAMSSAGDMGDDMTKVIEAFCPHEEALTCLLTTPACVAEGEEESTASMSSIPCICGLNTACPSAVTIMNKEVGDDPTPEQCAMMLCVLGEKKCTTVVASMDPEDTAKADKCGAAAAAGSDSGDPPATSGAVIHNEALVIVVMSVIAFLMS